MKTMSKPTIKIVQAEVYNGYTEAFAMRYYVYVKERAPLGLWKEWYFKEAFDTLDEAEEYANRMYIIPTNKIVMEL